MLVTRLPIVRAEIGAHLVVEVDVDDASREESLRARVSMQGPLGDYAGGKEGGNATTQPTRFPGSSLANSHRRER